MLTKKILSLIIVFSITGCTGKTSGELYAEGVREFQQGNVNGAIVFFKNALEKNQNYLDARYQLARTYKAAGKYDQAANEFLKVQKQNLLLYQKILTILLQNHRLI